jgi:hypothetical protein
MFFRSTCKILFGNFPDSSKSQPCLPTIVCWQATSVCFNSHRAFLFTLFLLHLLTENSILSGIINDSPKLLQFYLYSTFPSLESTYIVGELQKTWYFTNILIHFSKKNRQYLLREDPDSGSVSVGTVRTHNFMLLLGFMSKGTYILWPNRYNRHIQWHYWGFITVVYGTGM